MQSSFDLFTTRTAETTDMLLRRLTFLSVLLGGMGALAGVFGMNFQPPFAKSAEPFWVVVSVLLAATAGGVVIGRRRKWI